MMFPKTTGVGQSLGVAGSPVPGLTTAAPHVTGVPFCPTIMIFGGFATNLAVKKTPTYGVPTQDLLPSTAVFYQGLPAVTMLSSLTQDAGIAAQTLPDHVKKLVCR